MDSWRFDRLTIRLATALSRRRRGALAATLGLAALPAAPANAKKKPKKCKGGKKRCGGECVDPQTDDRHCGGCDRPCRPGQTCRFGRCTSCGDNEHECADGACVPNGVSGVCCTSNDCPPNRDLTCPQDTHRCACIPGAAQCEEGGRCVYLGGCEPGVESTICTAGPCGRCGDDTVCGSRTPSMICCNQSGPGQVPVGACVDPAAGGFCPPRG